jgi:hypothetical protein
MLRLTREMHPLQTAALVEYRHVRGVRKHIDMEKPLPFRHIPKPQNFGRQLIKNAENIYLK